MKVFTLDFLLKLPTKFFAVRHGSVSVGFFNKILLSATTHPFPSG